MKAALLRAAEGKTVRLPLGVYVHLIAQRYGQSPEAVRDWPADDFMLACNLLGMTR